jgi:hypothetical protein
MAHLDGSAQKFESFAKAGGRFGLNQGAKLCSDLIHRLRAHAHSHAFPRTHGVYRYREGTNLPVDCRSFDQQGLSTARCLHLAIG